MVTIQLPEHIAAALEANAAAAGLDLPSYLAQLALEQGTEDRDRVDNSERLAAWQRLMDAVKPSGAVVDDSRESIYPDRS